MALIPQTCLKETKDDGAHVNFTASLSWTVCACMWVCLDVLGGLTFGSGCIRASSYWKMESCCNLSLISLPVSGCPGQCSTLWHSNGFKWAVMKRDHIPPKQLLAVVSLSMCKYEYAAEKLKWKRSAPFKVFDPHTKWETLLKRISKAKRLFVFSDKTIQIN